ncbi:MAG TPA: competence/damage-inducible protein A [Tepidisphaeraceae bacterium]|nr:competence/damage-inducible protein A [Tepidisphaeraceae bacterium]
MKAILLSTGDELVLGQTIDTNSAWLSQQLATIGIPVVAHITVGDQQADIEQAILESVGRCDVLLVTGGIGPTEDDRTRHALAEVLRAPLELNETALFFLNQFFQRLNRPMPETNKIQAMIPHGVRLIENSAGTAAGMDADYQSPDEKTICRILVMPGVPKEMKQMFTNSILLEMKKWAGEGVILSKTLHTFGLGESSIAEKLGELMARTRNPSVGTTVANGIVSLRINSRYSTHEQAQQELDITEQSCRDALGELIFGADDESLPSVVADLLLKDSKSVTTAESCTGGLLAKMLTDISGSSAYFTQGWIAYANAAKHDRLGVPTEILNLYGAVSEPVVEHLAKNARRLAKADFALAISGIAGPTGGTPAKPVGTVCICLAYTDPNAAPPDRVSQSNFTTRTFTFSGDREMIRDRSAKMALTMLRFHLLKKQMPF